jgi:hypothetical protein
MAPHAKSFEEVKALDAGGRTDYFEEYAGYFPDSPVTPYAIRVGSRTLFSNDTHDLREQFDKLLRYGPAWRRELRKLSCVKPGTDGHLRLVSQGWIFHHEKDGFVWLEEPPITAGKKARGK